MKLNKPEVLQQKNNNNKKVTLSRDMTEKNRKEEHVKYMIPALVLPRIKLWSCPAFRLMNLLTTITNFLCMIEDWFSHVLVCGKSWWCLYLPDTDPVWKVLMMFISAWHWSCEESPDVFICLILILCRKSWWCLHLPDTDPVWKALMMSMSAWCWC